MATTLIQNAEASKASSKLIGRKRFHSKSEEGVRSALKRVTLAGPTLFGPVLKAAAMLAAIDSEKKYYCLLLITDGVLQDMPVRKSSLFALPDDLF